MYRVRVGNIRKLRFAGKWAYKIDGDAGPASATFYPLDLFVGFLLLVPELPGATVFGTSIG